jgi:hypothetical protein
MAGRSSSEQGDLMIKRSLALLTALATAALLALAGSGAAVAEPTGPGVMVGGRCASGYVQVRQGPVNVRTAPRTDAPIVGSLAEGVFVVCDPPILVGDVYRNTCGASVANGWLKIGYRGVWRYAVSVCFNDVWP